MPITFLSEDQAAQQAQQNGTMSQFMKPKFARAPIKEAGRVAYLGESSNLSLLVHDRHGTTDVVHYPLPDTVKGTRARLTELDNIEIDILHTRGAFLLPPRALCDELVDAYFKWVAPVVPVINKARFMRRYRDHKNPPSLLLLQAILLAGSRVCTNPQLMDSNGSTTPAAMTFYKRAKALYDANYEDDRVTIVQALVLMGWYWEGPEGTHFPYNAANGANLARRHQERLLLEQGGDDRRARLGHAQEVGAASDPVAAASTNGLQRRGVAADQGRQATVEAHLVDPVHAGPLRGRGARAACAHQHGRLGRGDDHGRRFHRRRNGPAR